MSSTLRISLGALALLGLAACGGDDDGGGGGPGPTPDAGPMVTPDTGPGMEFSCAYPPAPYGASTGRTFESFTLTNCADGTPFSFYNEDYCSGSVLTVVSIAAGWCGPCRLESAMLEEHINQVYGPMGVRVIQIVVQTDDYSAASIEYCQDWVDTYGLSNIELTDPFGMTQRYFPDNSLPSTLIIDHRPGHEAEIRFRENGVSDGLISLRAKLDELLAEM